MRRWLSRALVVSLGLGAASCQTLPDIQPGICGNLIVDPLEDCDGFVDPALAKQGLACGLQGTPSACRFDCQAEGHVCPTGFVCGGDAICRQPSGAFELLTSLPASSSLVRMGDFDGDGRSDLLTVDDDSGGIGVYFFERDGVLARSFSMASDGTIPAIGLLDTGKVGGGEDFTFALFAGLGVMRGQGDRAFDATAYASIVEDAWGDAALLATDVIPAPPLVPGQPIDPMQQRWVGDEVMVLHYAPAKFTRAFAFAPALGGKDLSLNAVLPLPVNGGWDTRIPLGNLDEDPFNSPCNEFVLTDPDASKAQVWIITPCLRPTPSAALTWNNNGKLGPLMDLQTTYPTVKLSGGFVPKSVLIAQLNPLVASQSPVGRDRHLDLLIEGRNGAATQVFAAYGLGNGTFSSSVPMPGGNADNLAAPYPSAVAPLTVMPLAVGDLNGDEAPDFVFPTSVVTSNSGSSPTTYAAVGLPMFTPAWTDALMVDYDGDGAMDVVAGSSADVGVQLFTNAGNGTFNPEFVATASPVSGFVTGDFDGDLQADIAFRLGPVGDAGGKEGGNASVAVMFGRRGEYPDSPRYRGELSTIDQLLTGKQLIKRVPETSVSDILSVSLSGGKSARAAAYLGRPDREIQAPYFFKADGSSVVGFAKLATTAIAPFHALTSAEKAMKPFNDVAALGVTPAQGEPSTSALLWLLHPIAGAQFDDAPVSVELVAKTSGGAWDTSNVAWNSAVMEPIDVDGDGERELVILAPDADDTGHGGLLLATAGSESFSVAWTAALNEGVFNPRAPTGKPGLLRRNQPLCTGFVDGDKYPDLVALTATSDGLTPQVAIFWGTGDKSAPFDLGKVAHVSLDSTSWPAGETITGFTCLPVAGAKAPVPGGLGLELFIVTDKGAYAVAPGGGRTLVGKPLANARNGQGSTGFLPGGVSIAAGNVDDDQVPDLVISGPTSASIFLGKARNP